MIPSPESVAFDRGIDPLFRLFTPEVAREIAEYSGDEALRDKIEQLAAKANEDQLTEEERKEYEGYVRANKFVAVLQAKARQRLNRTGR